MNQSDNSCWFYESIDTTQKNDSDSISLTNLLRRVDYIEYSPFSSYFYGVSLFVHCNCKGHLQIYILFYSMEEK